MADRRHSTVFDFLTAVTTDVQHASYPPNPVTGRTPWLDSQGLPPESFDEFVTVNQAVDDGEIVWAVVGPNGRDETSTLEIVVDTAIPGRSKLEVIARLAELADVVQSLYFNPDTYTFTPPDVDGALQMGGVVGVASRIEATSSGHVGRAVIRLELRARI